MSITVLELDEKVTRDDNDWIIITEPGGTSYKMKISNFLLAVYDNLVTEASEFLVTEASEFLVRD